MRAGIKRTGEMMNTLLRILKAALVVFASLMIVAVLLFVALAYAAPYIPIHVASIGFYLTKPITKGIVSATAMDVWIARALALVFYAIVMFSLAGWIKNLSPPNILFSKRGRILLFSTWCVGCIAMSFLSKNVYFSQEGTPQKRYYRHPDCSIESFPIEMDYHPIYGKPLRLITTEIVEEAENRKAGNLTARLTSIPAGAQIFFNWKYEGTTPATMTKQNLSGHWIIVKDGYVPELREQLDCAGGDSLVIALRPQTQNEKMKALLDIQDGPASSEIFQLMSDELTRREFLIVDQGSASDFKKAWDESGGLKNRALVAWARAEFGADILLVMNVRQYSKDLGETDVGYHQIQESLKGVYRAETTADIEIVDTKSGETVSFFSIGGQSTSLGESKSLRESLSKALYKAAEKITKEIGKL